MSRELDAEVAARIFGGPEQNVQWYWWKNSTPALHVDPPLYAGPAFSTDIAAAWAVLATFRAYELKTSDRNVRRHVCRLWGHGLTPPAGYAEANTAAEAICKAALAAVSGGEEG